MDKPGGFFSKTAAVRYKDLARQMREEASKIGVSELKREMLRIAESCERLARWAKMLQPAA
jgi:hypothetical protein